MEEFLSDFSTPILIGILTLFVALNGVVFEIKKDPDKPPGLKNMSTAGKIAALVIVVLGTYTVVKQILDERNAASDNEALKNQLKDAQLQRADIANVVNEIGSVQKDIGKNTIKIDNTTTQISAVSNLTTQVTTESKTILEKIQQESEQSIKNQAAVLNSLRILEVKFVDQESRIGSLVKDASPQLPPLVESKPEPTYAKVTFNSLTTGENCEATPGNQGEFYYEFFANGKKLANAPYSLQTPLKLKDNDTKQGLGVIDGLRVFSEEDTITVSGYIRERDPKNWLGKWTYKYAGTFSTTLAAKTLTSPYEIQVVEKKDCQLRLGIGISVYQ